MIRIFFVAVLALGMVACGGGGGARESTNDTPTNSPPVSEKPNILLIIADDLGIDASAQYPYSLDAPITPTLDQLATEGLVFENFWATPSCASTRASLLTGRYGINNGVPGTPGRLDPMFETLQGYLASYPQTQDYTSAVFGKWHLGGPGHAASVGIPYYAGNLQNLDDYFSWELTVNGDQQISDAYHTSLITDLAIDWIRSQSGPWFAWLAYAAPHPPFHVPPAHLHDRDLSGTETDIANNRRNYYLAAIEAMDAEIGRLLGTLPAEQRDNTLIIFIGDNGTPRGVIDRSVFAPTHGKNSLYEGGLRAPLIVSGAGVSRLGERESALISSTDLFATIARVAGSNVESIHDSVSFAEAFMAPGFVGRPYLYVSYFDADLAGRAVRDAVFKVLETDIGGPQLYDVTTDIAEVLNLLPGDAETEAKRAELLGIADQIEASGGPGGPGSGDPIDITDAILTNQSSNCAEYAESFTSAVTDIGRNLPYYGDLNIAVAGGKCVFSTNAIPNHDFNDAAGFATFVSEQNDTYEITASPQPAQTTTNLSLTFDNAILLNGVKVDLLAAACFGVGDERTGCNNINQPWRFDPLYPANGFRFDTHNAHTQPDGTYHYHGNPNALFYADTNIESPVIGFAADGFPIFGSYFDDNGLVRKAQSSYQLKSGLRPSGPSDPGGSYDGTFRDDYEFVSGSGDLDECNGMSRNGVYGYYVTEGFPYILGCFTGSPDPSFMK